MNEVDKRIGFLDSFRMVIGSMFRSEDDDADFENIAGANILSAEDKRELKKAMKRADEIMESSDGSDGKKSGNKGGMRRKANGMEQYHQKIDTKKKSTPVRQEPEKDAEREF